MAITLTKLTNSNVQVDDGAEPFVSSIGGVVTGNSGSHATFKKGIDPITLLWSDVTGAAQTAYNDWDTYFATEFV